MRTLSRYLAHRPLAAVLVAAPLTICGCSGADTPAGGEVTEPAADVDGSGVVTSVGVVSTVLASSNGTLPDDWPPMRLLRGLPLVQAHQNEPSVLRDTRWAATSRDLPWAEMTFSSDLASFVSWDGVLETYVVSYAGSWNECASRFCLVLLDQATRELSTLEFRVHDGELVIGDCAVIDASNKHDRRAKFMQYVAPGFDDLYLSDPPRVCRLAHDRGYLPIPLP